MTASDRPSLEEDFRLTEETASGRAEAWLWWSTVPVLPHEKVGVIGNFSAESPEAIEVVLRSAERKLKDQGCTVAVGPMDGNTWRRYRFMTDVGAEPVFFLEPTNPPEWPDGWRQAGYSPLAEYYSTATNDLAVADPRLDSVAARLAESGVTIRSLNPQSFEEELGRIYDVSVVSFRDNFLYTPLALGAFAAQYRKIQSYVDPRLVLIAEQAGHPVGYVFALPDLAQAQRGESVKTIIVKTLAVLPGRAYAGLGALLLGKVHAAAHAAGFTRAIHALMHETNKSRNLSAHYAQTIRRYTLFSKRLNA